MKRSAFAMALGILWTGTIASANDSSFGGRGSDLTPLTETRVRMVSERIELVLTEDRYADAAMGMAWRVRATYQFHNDSDEQVTLQIGFPETPCDPDQSDCNGRTGRFRRMRTTVRGEQVQHRMGEVTDRILPGRRDEYPRLGRVFLYDVTFEPDERVEIVHRYTHDRSFSAAFGETLTYLTRTGANWNGPIDDARFIVRVPYLPSSVLAHRDYPGERLLVRRDGVPEGIELRFHLTDFRPTHDFDLMLIGDLDPEMTVAPPQILGVRCPSVDDDLSEVPDDTLRLCAAVVQAFYGGPADAETTEALGWSSAFEGMEDDPWAEQWAVVPPHPHPQYEPAWMREDDRRYVEALESALEGDAPSTPQPPPPGTTPTVPGIPTPAPATPPAQTTTCGSCTVGAGTNASPRLLWLLALLGYLRVRRSRSTTARRPLGRRPEPNP